MFFTPFLTIAQYLYNIDPIAFPSFIPGGTQTTGLVDLLALDNSGKKFIALERSFSLGAL
ncbi:hypothetical protein [Gloeothece citriformis]|uniref:hypothetical protein n=1 Tax=Gloeothece citriformis TaxID=2546356 RepID=UPI00031B8F96|nr:hypothetical protein [Gloeothece citriformis]